LSSDALETEIPLDSPAAPERNFPTHSVLGSRADADLSEMASSKPTSADNDAIGFSASSRSQESRTTRVLYLHFMLFFKVKSECLVVSNFFFQ
jgi:hypothetical protein